MNKRIPTLLWIALSVMVYPLSAFASEVSQAPSAPCGVLEGFGGQIEILDATRTHLIAVESHAAIPCSGWVSVGNNGWAGIRHRDGHWIQAGSDTFMQLQLNEEHAVLYQGQLYLKSEGGSGELKVVSANARVRLSRASGIFLYSKDEDESQLIAIQNQAKIENRFSDDRAIVVKAGEASSLNLKALRVVPGVPRAVTLASLKQKMVDLQVPEKEQTPGLVAARDRQGRTFAAVLATGETSSASMERSQRAPAGLELDSKKMSRYIRHQVKEDDGQIQKQLGSKLVAGDVSSQKLLFPDRFNGRPQKVKVLLVDPLAKQNGLRKKEDELERARLIEELSQISPE